MIVEFMPQDWKPSALFKEALEFGMEWLMLDEEPGLLIIEKQSTEVDQYDADSVFDGIDTFDVRIWNEDPATIFHELVHVMQYANDELEVYEAGHGYWQGKVVKGMEYEHSPWEVEAYRLEALMTKSFERHLQNNS